MTYIPFEFSAEIFRILLNKIYLYQFWIKLIFDILLTQLILTCWDEVNWNDDLTTYFCLLTISPATINNSFIKSNKYLYILILFGTDYLQRASNTIGILFSRLIVNLLLLASIDFITNYHDIYISRTVCSYVGDPFLHWFKWIWLGNIINA